MVNMVKILRLYIFKQFVLQFQALDPKQLIQNFWKDIASEMTGFYMKCKTELKCVKAICPSRHIPVHIYKWRHQINEFNVLTKPVKVTPPPLRMMAINLDKLLILLTLNLFIVQHLAYQSAFFDLRKEKTPIKTPVCQLVHSLFTVFFAKMAYQFSFG